MKTTPNILVTGATGFVGSHFCDLLIREQAGHVHITKRWRSSLTNLETSLHSPYLHLHECELRDPTSVHSLIETVQPDLVFHFAAQGAVGVSWNYPTTTIQDDFLMQVNLFEAIRRLAHKPKIFVPLSAEEYGKISPNDLPISEDHPLRPVSPYAVGKATQEMLAFQYHASYDLPIYMARSFNQEGPRRPSAFAIASFAKQIALIEKGKNEPVLRVGNLAARRDFIDVRDSVRAYWKIVNEGQVVTPYNICTGTVCSIQDILDTLLTLSTREIEVLVDPERLRPSDIPELRGCNSKVKQAIDWDPCIPIEQTVADVLNYWRQHV